MINIIDKHKCCGCSACVQICPKQCIDFDEDEEGFKYPLVNKDLCVDCGKCEIVCPCLNQNKSQEPLNVYAAINPNEEIRFKSSSGGIFTMLAENILKDGGVVFGACFDNNWEVVHDYIETIEDIEYLRGAKYSQSYIGNSYKKCHDFLEQGRKVLFSGTPCQIAGLNKYLSKDYINLLTVDCCCHGVPSPKIWRDYLGIVTPSIYQIKRINFRDKKHGWEKYGLKVSLNNDHKNIYIPKYKNPYMFAFLHDYSLRPSCYNCPSRRGKSTSDITIGDFWGIGIKKPQYYHKDGVSLILIRSVKGKNAYEMLDATIGELSYEDALYENGCLERSAKEPIDRQTFWKLYHTNGFVSTWPMLRRLEPSAFRRIITNVRGIVRNIIGK